MVVLGIDTATPATAVALLRADGQTISAYEEAAADGRPAHAAKLLTCAAQLLTRAELDWRDIQRIAVGIGPGTFTGLRIGIATARGLAQSLDAELSAVGTLRALADGAAEQRPAPLAAVLDARRGEAFVAVYEGERELRAPVAVRPQALEELAASWPGMLAVGDGAVRFRQHLHAGGATVPADDSPLHRVDAAVICRRGADGPAVAIEAVQPAYHRRPDAELARDGADH